MIPIFKWKQLLTLLLQNHNMQQIELLKDLSFCSDARLVTPFACFASSISEIDDLLLPSCDMTDILLKRRKSLNTTSQRPGKSYLGKEVSGGLKKYNSHCKIDCTENEHTCVDTFSTWVHTIFSCLWTVLLFLTWLYTRFWLYMMQKHLYFEKQSISLQTRPVIRFATIYDRMSLTYEPRMTILSSTLNRIENRRFISDKISSELDISMQKWHLIP